MVSLKAQKAQADSRLDAIYHLIQEKQLWRDQQQLQDIDALVSYFMIIIQSKLSILNLLPTIDTRSTQ